MTEQHVLYAIILVVALIAAYLIYSRPPGANARPGSDLPVPVNAQEV